MKVFWFVCNCLVESESVLPTVYNKREIDSDCLQFLSLESESVNYLKPNYETGGVFEFPAIFQQKVKV